MRRSRLSGARFTCNKEIREIRVDTLLPFCWLRNLFLLCRSSAVCCKYV